MSCFRLPLTPSSSSLPPRKSRSFCTKSRTRGCTLRGLQEPPTLSEMPLHRSLIIPIFSHLFSFQDLIEKPAYSALSLHFPAGAFLDLLLVQKGRKTRRPWMAGGKPAWGFIPELGEVSVPFVTSQRGVLHRWEVFGRLIVKRGTSESSSGFLNFWGVH